jgi:hypothetical protein
VTIPNEQWQRWRLANGLECRHGRAFEPEVADRGADYMPEIFRLD